MKNIVLTGFMGTGKSTVGQQVAQQLQRTFIDMDTLIEQREGRPITQIFADAGEPYFREVEAHLCTELAQRHGLVIATGGGALVPEANLQVMKQTSLIICLTCQPDVLWQRIGHSQSRPMLAAQDKERFARLSALFEKRTPAYARIPHQIEVTRLSPAEVTAQVCQLVTTKSSQ